MSLAFDTSQLNESALRGIAEAQTSFQSAWSGERSAIEQLRGRMPHINTAELRASAEVPVGTGVAAGAGEGKIFQNVVDGLGEHVGSAVDKVGEFVDLGIEAGQAIGAAGTKVGALAGLLAAGQFNAEEAQASIWDLGEDLGASPLPQTVEEMAQEQVRAAELNLAEIFSMDAETKLKADPESFIGHGLEHLAQQRDRSFELVA